LGPALLNTNRILTMMRRDQDHAPAHDVFESRSKKCMGKQAPAQAKRCDGLRQSMDWIDKKGRVFAHPLDPNRILQLRVRFSSNPKKHKLDFIEPD
jgi:hypothetical protein